MDKINLQLLQIEKYYLELLNLRKYGKITHTQFNEAKNLLDKIETQIKPQQNKPSLIVQNEKDKNLIDRKTDKHKHKIQQNQIQQNQIKKEKEKQEELKKEEDRKIKLEIINYWKNIGKNDDEIIKSQNKFINLISKLDYNSRLKILEEQTVIREFVAEHNYSKKVVLLEHFIVKKYCSSFFTFNNEVNSLIKLMRVISLPEMTNYSHFPKLVAYDVNRFVIYMTFCGEMLSRDNLPNDWREQFERIRKIMALANVNSNDMLIRNTCILNKQIQIIDFGLDTIFGRSLEETTNKFYHRLSELEGSHNTINKLHRTNQVKIKIGK